MPPLPSPGAVIKLQSVWTVGTFTNAMNVLHFRYTGSRPTANDCNAIAARWLANFPAAIPPLYPASTILTGAIVTDLQGTDGFEGTGTASHPGTSASVALDASSSVVQSLKVQARYRGGHPRVYWPAPSVNMLQNPQNWTSAFVSSSNTAFQQWLQSMPGFTSGATTVGQHCAISYRSQKVLRPVPLVWDVQGYSVLARVGSQRRRLK